MSESGAKRTEGLSGADLFGAYMRLTGTPSLEPEEGESAVLRGKRLGIVNGSSWVTLWATYFGRKMLPGVKLINVGNDAVQLNFMRAHHEGRPCPPQRNIELFVDYAEQLVELFGVDAILITCSTMNRSAEQVREAMTRHDVPVVQIDEPMMDAAVKRGGKILVVATHGPTVTSTQALLQETADRTGKSVSFAGVTVEEAFHLLGKGDVAGHNEVVSAAIRKAVSREPVETVVLAQLSMSVFAFAYPDSERTFGAPVLTSGEEGFNRVRAILEAH